jgi:hypothetical protein
VKDLFAKYLRYLELIQSHQDVFGFVDTDHCDSTLWSGLIGASGVPVKLTSAENPWDAGQWHRKPLAYPECWKSGNSRSTISKDMLTGVMYWAVATRNLGVLQRLWDFGKANDWVMGQGRYDGIDTVMNPLWISTLAECIHYLGGKDHSWWRDVKPVFSKNGGFSAHLSVLIILLRKQLGVVDKGIDSILEYHAERQPQNALFQYAVGNYSEAEKLLLNEAWWPADRLPTNRDRKESWLLQRDYGDDWLPAKSGEIKEYHGGDFLFVANLLLSRDKV